jgi:hypothetical protein
VALQKVLDSTSKLNSSALTVTDVDQLAVVLTTIIANISGNPALYNNSKLALAAAAALDKILTGASYDTTIASASSLAVESAVPLVFTLLPVSTFVALAQAADQLLELSLGSNVTAVNYASQNLIKSLQVAASRVSGQLQAGDAALNITGNKF